MENKIETKQKEFEDLCRQLLNIMDPNPDRPELKETPHRMWKYYHELLAGQFVSNSEIAKDATFNKCFDFDEGGDVDTDSQGAGGLVVEKHIPVFSTCEHHIALMYDMYVDIGYIPNKKIIGLSKLGRISDLCARRLQVQERIGEDIAEVLEEILGTKDIAVVITGKHSCMTARGIKSREAVTRTATLKGRFLQVSDLRNEFYNLIK